MHGNANRYYLRGRLSREPKTKTVVAGEVWSTKMLLRKESQGLGGIGQGSPLCQKLRWPERDPGYLGEGSFWELVFPEAGRP